MTENPTPKIDLDILKSGTYGQTLTPAQPYKFGETLLDPKYFVEAPRFQYPPMEQGHYQSKLTPFEQRALERLPGMAESEWMQDLQGFLESDNIFAKGINALAWLGEQAEKAFGTTYQVMADPDFEIGDLRGPAEKAKLQAAWNASANFYESIAPRNAGVVGGFVDLMSRPNVAGMYKWSISEFAKATWTVVKEHTGIEMTDEELARHVMSEKAEAEYLKDYENFAQQLYDHWKAVFAGYETDTGGLPALIEARQAILAGQDPEAVKQEYLQSVGELAIRGQMYDFLGQALLDPGNIVIGGMLKIPEKVSGLRHTIRFNRVASEVSNGMGDIVKITDTLFDAGGDMVKGAEDIVKIADDLGIDELSDIAGDLAKVLKEGKDPSKAYDKLNDLLKTYKLLDELNPLGPFYSNVSWGHTSHIYIKLYLARYTLKGIPTIWYPSLAPGSGYPNRTFLCELCL